MRTAEIKRKTKETDIEVFVKLDGEGKVSVNTGIGFFDICSQPLAFTVE